MWNLPNILTFFRIAVILPIVALFFIPEAWAAWTALGLYTLAAISDFFDGYLARKMNLISPVGVFLDPIADKLLVAAVLIMLAAYDRLEGLWIIPALAILVREIFIAGLREYLGPFKITLPVSTLAKWKTTSQLFALGFLIVGPYAPSSIPSLTIGHYLMTLAAILSVVTAWRYSITGFQHIMKQ